MSDHSTAASPGLAAALPAAKLAAGAISDYYAFQLIEGAKLNTILALEMELTQDRIPGSKDLCIYADVVSFKAPQTGAPLAMPGRNLTISARRIITNGVKLDASGRTHQRFSPGARATDGLSGQGGTDGASGSRGQDAGAITLIAEEFVGQVVVDAIGGQGERGQDGGNGGVGLAGDNGPDAVIGGSGWMQSITRSPEAGRKGKTGGRGGNAGMSGAGGSGGRVTVISVKPMTKPAISAQGGSGGAKATPGKGGLGGPGGLGGRNASCRTFGRPPDISRICSHDNSRAASGPAGDSGTYGAEMGSAQPGPSQTPVVTTSQDYLQYFFAKTAAPADLQLPPPPVEQRQLVLHQAELRYVNGEFNQAVVLLDWLVQVTPSASTQPGPGRDMPAWRSIHERAITLLRQIRSGLNYYGKPENSVPLAALSFYQKQLPDLLNTALVLEDAYNKYAADNARQDAQMQALRTAIDQVKAGRDTIVGELDHLKRQIPEVQNAIASLSLSVESQANAVLAASTIFQEGLIRATACESFMKLVANIACIVQMGSAAFATFKAIRGAYGASRAGGDATLSNVIKELKPISDDDTIGSIRESIGKIQSLNTPSMPDAGKLAVSREDFDKMIQPYESLPEAQAYKTVMHNYLDGVQARNDKVLEYNGLVAKQATLEEKIRQSDLTRQETEDAMAKGNDPTVPRFRAFMQGAYLQLKNNVLRFLFEENQAFIYWALEPRAFLVSDQTVAQLKTTHARLSSDVLEHINGSTAPFQPFTAAEVRLTEEQLQEQFRALVRGRNMPGRGREHSIAIQIRLSQPAFKGCTNVLARSFALELPGAKTSNGLLMVRLIHSGRALFRNQSGKQFEFSHLYRKVHYNYELTTGKKIDGGNLAGEPGQESQIIGVSPFSTWTIIVRDSGDDQSENPGLDLSKLEKIVFRFKGRWLRP